MVAFMKAHISKRRTTRNVAKVNNILRHELEVGEIKSISPILSKLKSIADFIPPTSGLRPPLHIGTRPYRPGASVCRKSSARAGLFLIYSNSIN